MARDQRKNLQIGVGLAGCLVLLVTPLLGWREFRAGKLASAQLRGIRSPYGREVLILAAFCSALWIIYLLRTTNPAGRYLMYSVTLISLAALIPLLQFASDTTQLETLSSNVSPVTTISGGFGLLVAFLADIVIFVVGLLSAIGDTRHPQLD